MVLGFDLRPDFFGSLLRCTPFVGSVETRLFFFDLERCDTDDITFSDGFAGKAGYCCVDPLGDALCLSISCGAHGVIGKGCDAEVSGFWRKGWHAGACTSLFVLADQFYSCSEAVFLAAQSLWWEFCGYHVV
jgi:hypothetical protein